jgi:phage terminase large subunit-like protein
VNAGREAVEALLALPEAEAEAVVSGLDAAALRALALAWEAWRHEGQAEPPGDWRVWVMTAGRGFGKTRAGAEWVSAFARAHPGARIALVAATPDEARRVMVEGVSGLIAVARPGEPIEWEPSRRRLRFASGAEAALFSGANPEGLRGPEHHIAWCDELAKWRRAQEAWANLQLGLRLGERPRTLVTTTPRPVPALKALLGEDGVVRTSGASRANPFTSRAFLEAMERIYGGTRLGRQELEGELIEDLEGALWTRELIEAARTAGPVARAGLRRVVVGVDPPAGSDGDACGIVVCGVGETEPGFVLADLSAQGLSPEGWARKVAAAAEAWSAHRIVAEANNGGRMVESVLRGAGLPLPVKRVHASDGKAARAEPVATLFESGRARFAGRFPELEDELAGLTRGGGYQGPGRSPDRADAMVWAMSELMLGPAPPEPRIRTL